MTRTRPPLAVPIFMGLAACTTMADGPTDPYAHIGVYERADWNRDVTECDRLATHPSDPEAVLDNGVTRDTMDKPAAIEACLAALERDPENPRLNYQLARAYGYSGLHEQGDAYRARAVGAGYPQALFVYGYIRIESWDGRPADPCYGGELVRRSAEAGRFAGLVGFPHYVQTGAFDECDLYPRIDINEINGFLEEAEGRASGYYQTILVETLQDHFAGLDN